MATRKCKHCGKSISQLGAGSVWYGTSGADWTCFVSSNHKHEPFVELVPTAQKVTQQPWYAPLTRRDVNVLWEQLKQGYDANVKVENYLDSIDVDDRSRYDMGTELLDLLGDLIHTA